MFKIQTICFVCGRVINGKIKYIGKDMYRHENCKPGSARWMRSYVGRKSGFRDFFLSPSGENENTGASEEVE